MQKSFVFPYTRNEQSENEIKKIISFTIGSKRIKYLGINVTKEVQDLCNENYKTFLKEIKKGHKNGKTSGVYELEGIILLRWQYTPKWSSDSM